MSALAIPASTDAPITAVAADELLEGLFNKLDSVDNDAEALPLLIAEAATIRSIARAYRATPLFQRAADQYALIKSDIERDVAPESRLLHAWQWLMDRMSSAPSGIHMVGAIRLCLPLVADYLPADENPTAAIVQRITFKDCGQDFFDWYVRDGIVIDCQPHQGATWVGKQVTNQQYLKPGLYVIIISPETDAAIPLRYPVEAVATLCPEEAARVEAFGRKWAEIKGVTVESLGLAPAAEGLAGERR